VKPLPVSRNEITHLIWTEGKAKAGICVGGGGEKSTGRVGRKVKEGGFILKLKVWHSGSSAIPAAGLLESGM
jgi:hypothetical protein